MSRFLLFCCYKGIKTVTLSARRSTEYTNVTIVIFIHYQDTNCCRNSRLVEDEDDLKLVANDNI